MLYLDESAIDTDREKFGRWKWSRCLVSRPGQSSLRGAFQCLFQIAWPSVIARPVTAYVLEPPCTDPYAGWCGRGRWVTAAPMPIKSRYRKLNNRPAGIASELFAIGWQAGDCAAEHWEYGSCRQGPRLYIRDQRCSFRAVPKGDCE
jgi:hypothetical protein